MQSIKNIKWDNGNKNIGVSILNKFLILQFK